MRSLTKHKLLHFSEEMDRKMRSEQGDLQQSMDFWVTNFGAQAASWLIWKHRRQLLARGAVDFKMPRSTPTPPWFRVAMETLKRKDKKWTVTYPGSLRDPQKTFRVTWLCWKNLRGLPTDPFRSLQPAG